MQLRRNTVHTASTELVTLTIIGVDKSDSATLASLAVDCSALATPMLSFTLRAAVM